MASQKELMLRGEPYLSDDPDLAVERLRCRLLLERLNATSAAQPQAIGQILRELLGDFAGDAYVQPPLYCDYGYSISIGPRSFLNFGTVILDCARVSIGADVQIGPNVQLLTVTHPLGAAARRERWESAHPIDVGDGAWLGGGVIVCPGVRIGANAVVGAGSVVTRDVPAGHVAFGNPCRAVRGLPPDG
jgi:maltose O-acetyltransferase